MLTTQCFRAFFEAFAREAGGGGAAEGDIPSSQIRSMLAQRMQSYLMQVRCEDGMSAVSTSCCMRSDLLRAVTGSVWWQDRKRLRAMWDEYDRSKHGVLNIPQIHALLNDLGADIRLDECKRMVGKLAAKPGMIGFEVPHAVLPPYLRYCGSRRSTLGFIFCRQEFTVNFLGLPQGFFKMDLSQSQTWGDGGDEEGGGIAKGADALNPNPSNRVMAMPTQLARPHRRLPRHACGRSLGGTKIRGRDRVRSS